MSKLLCFSAFLCVLLTACAPKADTPEDVAMSFCDMLFNKHDLDAAAEMCTPDSREKLRTDFQYINGAIAVMEEETENNYVYRVVKDLTMYLDDTAYVIIHSDFDDTDMPWKLVKEEASWKIDFNYNNNSMQKELLEDVVDEMGKYVGN
ncbi:MAG: hypothetical protein R2794_05415 [Chitinophagales bacterium]